MLNLNSILSPNMMAQSYMVLCCTSWPWLVTATPVFIKSLNLIQQSVPLHGPLKHCVDGIIHLLTTQEHWKTEFLWEWNVKCSFALLGVWLTFCKKKQFKTISESSGGFFHCVSRSFYLVTPFCFNMAYTMFTDPSFKFKITFPYCWWIPERSLKLPDISSLASTYRVLQCASSFSMQEPSHQRNLF